MTNSPNTVTDLLTIIAPPLRLVSWLEMVFENKRKKGEDIEQRRRELAFAYGVDAALVRAVKR